MTRKSGKNPTTRHHPVTDGKSVARTKLAGSASRSKRRPEALRAAAHDSPKPPSVQTKQSQVIALMQRDEGASFTELIEATQWQPHSVRGVISGVLRKKLGLKATCTSSPESGDSRYRILESATIA